MDLIVLFVDICLFKKGPQNVPASGLLFWMALTAYWVVGFCLLVSQADWPDALIEVVVESALLLAFVWAMLYFALHWTGRFLQTATAMLATDVVISAPGSLVLEWLRATSGAMPMFLLALVALMIWQVSVVAHILRHALDRPLWYGFIAAVAYFLVSYSAVIALFNQGASGA